MADTMSIKLFYVSVLVVLCIQGSTNGFPHSQDSANADEDQPGQNATDLDNAEIMWSNWTDCSLSCGGGEKERSKLVPECNANITDPVANFTDCVEVVSCNTEHCPVNGVWRSWQPWGACSNTCGNSGFRKRRRKCRPKPAKRFGGEDCVGNKEETEGCNRHNCPVNGVWATWQPWGACSNTCGNSGIRLRRRKCRPKPAKRFGGEDCVGKKEDTGSCNRHNCPVHGGWGNWSEWSLPGVTCGIATVERTRTCTRPAPQHGGLMCDGWLSETRTEDTNVKCPVHGKWSAWSDWSQHSETCGKPVVERRRTCNNPAPRYNGKDCVGDAHQTKVVDTRVHCPIHGGWSEWSARSECPPSKRRWETRACNNPPRRHNGRRCNGSSQRLATCEPIVENGGWCLWEDWSACSKWCYDSTDDMRGIFKTKRRECECPKPKNGGQNCTGKASITETCAKEDLVSCAVPTKPPCTATTPDGGGYIYDDGEYDNAAVGVENGYVYDGNGGETATVQPGSEYDYESDCT